MNVGTGKVIANNRSSRSFNSMRPSAALKARIAVGLNKNTDVDDIERQMSAEARQTSSLLDELGGAPAPTGMVPSWLVDAFKSSKGRILSLEETRKILSKCKTSLSDEIINERENGN